MALLDILHFPDPRLRNRAQPVQTFGHDVERLIDDMLETMYAAPGIGLAATQANVSSQVIVIDISERKDEPLCLVNPRIVEERESVETEEGCLSVPGVHEVVQRAAWVRVEYRDRLGHPAVRDCDGLLAVCVQHEVDHLHGRLFVDYLSRLKRQRIRKKATRRLRENG